MPSTLDYLLKPNIQYSNTKGCGFKRWLGHKGVTLIIEISALCKEVQPRKLVYLFLNNEDTQQQDCVHEERTFHQTPNLHYLGFHSLPVDSTYQLLVSCPG